ncbi:unnamed protein product [Diplocarpon coronariae]|uniref:Uncharacterized protein n=1 Tax=Diplocarpon coronariae TaxID=2795749 RepID=A0A218ZJC9_9HELO|nr:hypothetical protein B2J93_4974 [Marssonina coronariae]
MPDEKTNLMILGLRESGMDIIGMIKQERKLVSLDRVILGGASQSYAAATLSPLASGVNLGGFAGFYSWLPLKHDITATTEVSVGGKFNSVSTSTRAPESPPPTEDLVWKINELVGGSQAEASNQDDVALDASWRRLTIELSETCVFGRL